MADTATAARLSRRLPVEMTGFVGRRGDRADVRRLLASSRLVTLTGFGGVGKTRLALRVASELARLYPDGVSFVPFADVADPALVADAVADALGFQDHTSRLDDHRLAEHLEHRELLLVFDNCEHLVDACAALADLLLRSCPRIRVLATSRESLRVQGEVVRPVLPLSLPSRMEGAGSGAEAYEAVQLLVERAGQVAPGFVLGTDNRAAVVEICRHLDGIPLALELAAVRLRVMSPGELLHQLREHWQLLDVGIRAAPDRHQTMTACLSWSHALCTAEEQELWARLSVFAGGMELDAVQHVAALSPAAATPERVPAVVQSLVDKSILVARPDDDRMRFRMLEVIRLYGADRLEAAGRLRAARSGHRDWYAGLLARFDEEWSNPDQVERMLRIRREDANLRAALRFCWQEAGEAATGLEMAARLRRYSMAYGWFTEGRLWLNRLLAQVSEPSPVRFGGLHAACWLAVLQGDREAAADLLAQSRDLAAGLGEPATTRAEELTGWYRLFTGDPAAAVTHLERAAEGFAAAGQREEQAETLVLLGMAHAFAGDLAQAAAAHAECLRICTGGTSPWARSYALQWGALVALDQGDRETARAWIKESLELKREIQERLGVALGLEALACIDCEKVPLRAARMLGASSALWRSMGSAPEALPGLLTYHDRCEATLRRLLPDGEFVRAFETGTSISADDAIAFALDETRSAGFSPAPTADAEQETARLTRREREIARLIADGLSNKDIATALVISTRTAESHVEHILVKLGFTSRAQIAAWVVQQPTSSTSR